MIDVVMWANAMECKGRGGD